VVGLPMRGRLGDEGKGGQASALLLLCPKAASVGTKQCQAHAGSSLSRMTIGVSSPFGTPAVKQSLGALSWRLLVRIDSKTA